MIPPNKKRTILSLDDGKIVLPPELLPVGVKNFACEQSENGCLVLIPLPIEAGSLPTPPPQTPHGAGKPAEGGRAQVIDFRARLALKRRQNPVSKDKAFARNEAFVMLQHFPSRLEAEMLGEILKQSELPYLIRSEDIGIFGPGALPSPGGACLVVRACDLEEAQSLLIGLIDLP